MDLLEHFNQIGMVGVQENDLTEDQKNIAVLTIDGNVIGGYYTYSFVRVKEYVKEPQRSQSGQIANLDGYTTFITPKVRVKFNALSIDGYKLLMNLILSKNEFYVGCYDFVADRWVHQNMYFYPNDYPEIFQYDLEVLAVLNYEIELIGTNTNNENITITLKSNYPISRGNTGDTRTDINGNEITGNSIYTISDAYQDEYTVISYPSNFVDNKEIIVDTIHFTFVGWNTREDGTGIAYRDGREAAFGGDTILYAMWDCGKVWVNFRYERDGQSQLHDEYRYRGKTFVSGQPTIYWWKTEDGKRYKYTVDDWYLTNDFSDNNENNTSIVGLYPHELTACCAYGQPTREEVQTS